MHRSRRRILSLAALTALVTLVIVAGPVHAGTGPSRPQGPSVDDGRSISVSSRATNLEPSGTTEVLEQPPRAPAG